LLCGDAFSVLVVLKVTLGSWAMVQLLVPYRGLF
jgi:hypothetical protein